MLLINSLALVTYLQFFFILFTAVNHCRRNKISVKMSVKYMYRFSEEIFCRKKMLVRKAKIFNRLKN